MRSRLRLTTADALKPAHRHTEDPVGTSAVAASPPPDAEDVQRRLEALRSAEDAPVLWRLERSAADELVVAPTVPSTCGRRTRRLARWEEAWSRRLFTEATGRPPTAIELRVLALHDAAAALTWQHDGSGGASLGALAVRQLADAGLPLTDADGVRFSVQRDAAQPRLVGLGDEQLGFALGCAGGSDLESGVAARCLAAGARDGFALLLRETSLRILEVDPCLASVFAPGVVPLACALPPEAIVAAIRAFRRRGIEVAVADDLDVGEALRSGRMELRLREAEGVLHVALRVAPFGDGATWQPGQGEQRVLGLGPRGLASCVRDLAGEREAAGAVVERLALPGNPTMSWFIEGADAMCALVERLEAHAHAVDIRWDSAPPTVRRVEEDELRIEIGGTDWTAARVEVDGEVAELQPLLEQLRGGARYVRLRPGSFAALSATLRQRLVRLGLLLQQREEASSPTVAAAVAASLAGEFDALGPAARDANVPPLPDISQPSGLRATLRPYQLEGFRFLVRAAAWTGGCLLADDMGLGKTLQAIAALLHRRGDGPALVVAPASVLMVWRREIARFAPDLTTRVVRRETARERAGRAGEVWLTTWSQLARLPDEFARPHFATLVLDEAQLAKNPTTARFAAARAVRADFRLLLSGTPVENRSEEAWALASLAIPGLLGTRRSFRERFGEKIDVHGDRAAATALSALLAPHVLRRRKEAVAPELPPRVEIEVPVQLTRDERARYDAVRRAARAELAKQREGGAGGEGAERAVLFTVLLRLRQLACHPRLCDPACTTPSAKLARVRALLGELRLAGRRALVFSQFTAHLDLCAAALLQDGAKVLRLDGRMGRAERAAACDAFQAGGADVMLLSLGAGGTGLTLTAADAVVLLDPWWNPALEAQATDRAHRIGQDRSVTVFRLISEGTVETQIRALQRRKAKIAAQVLGESRGGSLSTEALRALVEEALQEEAAQSSAVGVIS
ncbi:MAG: DEAD/DEAH box helicase [Deltaproteobacteria bacterium]|nr:DEAD/DEAH box helicase [Deltaproteobacteria bacterium]